MNVWMMFLGFLELLLFWSKNAVHPLNFNKFVLCVLHSKSLMLFLITCTLSI